MVDVTSLFSRFQKKLQSDKGMVFDIGEALERFISRLQQLNDGKTLISGFEEHLVTNVSEEDGKKILHFFFIFIFYFLSTVAPSICIDCFTGGRAKIHIISKYKT